MNAALVILLADDDENDVLIVQRALSTVKIATRLLDVTDGEETMACLLGQGQYSDRERWPVPHVLLLDYWMPRVTGLELLTAIRSQPRLAT